MNKQFDFFEPTKKMKILMLLMELNKNNNLSQQKLAKKIDVTAGQINNYIKELNKDEFVNKIKDGRKMKYKLTSNGQKRKWELIDELNKQKNDVIDYINTFNIEQDLNIAIIDSLGGVLPIIAQKIGLLPPNINIDKYISGKEVMEKLKKDYHYAFVGSTPAFMKMSAGLDIEIIAEVNTGGHRLIAKNKYNNLADLKNVEINLPVKASITENILNEALNEVFDTEQINIVENKNLISDIKENKNKDMEAFIIWEPYASIFLSQNNDYKSIFNFNSDESNYISTVLVKNNNLNFTEFDFEKIILETIEFVNNNQEKAISVLAEIWNIDLGIVKESFSNISYLYKKFSRRN